MNECPCEAVKRLWNKDNKTPDDIRALKILVPEQFNQLSDFYDEEGHKNYVYACKDCSGMIHVPSI